MKDPARKQQVRVRYTLIMAPPVNPYNWQTHNPQVEIPRSGVDRAVETLREGGSAVVLGGRGMGKSVFLQQVRTRLEEDPDTRVLLISAPPAQLSISACLGALARRLDVVSSHEDFSTSEIMERFFARPDAPRRLVLLFDEFDRYAEKGEPSSTPPGRGFFNDLEATRRDLSNLGILAAGSLGVFVVRDVLGSSFISRALHLRLRPLDRRATQDLARPFEDAERSLAPEVLDTLALATGGVPALLTFGLQTLWTADSPKQLDVAELYASFSRDHAAYLQDVLRSVTDPRLSDAPRRVLERIRDAEEALPRAELEAAMEGDVGSLLLELIDVLQLLEAAGLIRIDGSLFHDNPVHARPVTGLLNLPSGSGHEEGASADLFSRDLTLLLSKLHRSAADFFRPGQDGRGKRLVPESVFTAHLALGFELLGWRAEREAQSAAGRTDLKLRRNGDDEAMIVEVKIWGRNNYREAQDQVEGYLTDEIAAAAVVQIHDGDSSDWSEFYVRECLKRRSFERRETSSSMRARFAVLVEGRIVEHYLLRLPR